MGIEGLREDFWKSGQNSFIYAFLGFDVKEGYTQHQISILASKGYKSEGLIKNWIKIGFKVS